MNQHCAEMTQVGISRIMYIGYHRRAWPLVAMVDFTHAGKGAVAKVESTQCTPHMIVHGCHWLTLIDSTSQHTQTTVLPGSLTALRLNVEALPNGGTVSLMLISKFGEQG